MNIEHQKSTPKKRINHDQVRTAFQVGLPAKLIAERLHCSERQVRRICEGLQEAQIPFVGTDLEYVVWQGYKILGHSYREIGRIFCLSHEHIRQVLSEKFTTPSTKNLN